MIDLVVGISRRVVDVVVVDRGPGEVKYLFIALLAERVKKVSASHNSGEANKAIDGDIKTRWTTGASQKAGQWYLVDMGWEQTVSKVVLDAGSSKGDYPRGYEVYVSNNNENWGQPVAKGDGKAARLEISFAPKVGRFVRIVQTKAETGLWWSIHDLKIATSK